MSKPAFPGIEPIRYNPDAPATTLTAAITRISTHHAETNRRREKLLNM